MGVGRTSIPADARFHRPPELTSRFLGVVGREHSSQLALPFLVPRLETRLSESAYWNWPSRLAATRL